MYSIYADNLCIFDDTAPDRAHMAVGAKLTLSAGAAGSLTLQLPRGCAGYDSVQRLKTTISVKRDWDEIWMGRVLSEKDDIFGTKTLFCEGSQAWLNDTVQPTATFTGTPTQLLTAILTVHNNKASADRTIAVGDVTVTGSGLTAEVDYNTTLDAVNKLVSAYGGVLRMRYPSGVPTLDWLANYPTATGTPQALTFNENLLDFTRSWDLADYATVCYVRGGEDPNTEQTVYGSYTLQSAVTQYGAIEKFLNLTDCTTTLQCNAAAEDYLTKEQFDSMTLEVTAVDLHMLDPAIQPFDLLERVSVSSPLHGLTAAAFAVTGMDIPLDDPGNTRYTLGYVNVAYVRRANTLTQRTVQAETEQREYTDAAEMRSTEYTDSEITDAKEWVENSSQLKQEQDRIYMAVTKEVGGGARDYVQSAEVELTANQIKQRVSETTTDPQTGEPVTVWTVANLKSDGFHIADASGATLITGSMIDVDTIHVNKLYGGTIYLMVNDQTQAGSFYAEAAGALNPSALTINFENIWMKDAASIYLCDVHNVFVYNNGAAVSLASLLNI